MNVIQEIRPINEMPDVVAFLADWSTADPQRAPVRFAVSRFGNINDDGSEGGLTGRSYVPAQCGYELSVEPGVRELVVAFNTYARLVTYTSCEGHDYGAAPLKNSMRHVGILPRSHAEHESARLWLQELADQSNAALRDPVVTTTVFPHELREGLTGRVFPVLEVYFYRQGGTWRDYFESVDRVYGHFTRAVMEAAV